MKTPSSGPQNLLLAVPLRGKTVIRYAWRIDHSGYWDYFPNKGWGVPLGAREHDHPTLGHVLYEKKGGQSRQVLAGYAAGWRVMDL